MFGLGPIELILILLLIVIFVGGKKLPQVGENLGRGISEFKRAIKGDSKAPRTVDTTTVRRPSEKTSPHDQAERTAKGPSEE